VVALILVAAGSGQRLGADVPKALVHACGDTLVGHCLKVARSVADIAEIVVVAPPTHAASMRSELPGVQVVPGGQSRDASVRAGLDALSDQASLVLIHDAARPFTPAEVFRRVIDGLTAAVAVIPVVPVSDTIKQVSEGRVVRTVDRSDLVAVQTPQGFRVHELRAAHAGQTGPVTDDAMLMEELGHEVRVVEGAHEAFKITTPFDLAVARAMKEV
jgi:2-C-methyl-D-erythritol 4-phosphate cytidylyltransferase